jgi:hypothetical protein
MMRYAEIIAYLDAEISRLQRARDVLSGFRALETKPSRRKASAPKKKAGTAKLKAPASAKVEQAQVQIQRVPFKGKTKSRRIARASKTEQVAPTALSSHVPSGPVVVSREEVRKVRDREVALAQTAPQLPQAVENPGSGRSLGSLIRAMASKQALDGLIS